jgi:hypothetical protein
VAIAGGQQESADEGGKNGSPWTEGIMRFGLADLHYGLCCLEMSEELAFKIN